MSSLLSLENKQKKFLQTHFEFAYFYSVVLIHLGFKRQVCSYTPVVSSKNYTRFQTKMGKSIPVFRPKRPKIHTLCGGTNLHGLYRGVPPPPPAPGEIERQKCRTVKPRFTDTRFIQTHHYYGQFAVSLGKESPYIFSKFNPVNTDTFNVPLSVRINEV